jgi:acyl-CoA synthetase (AMP-forming)/AMP-acid ligase II
MKNTQASMLKKIIDQVPPDRVFLKSDFGELYFGQLKDLMVKFESEHYYLKSNNCALIASNRFYLAHYLPCLENIASSVFLQPNGLEESVVEEFYRQAQIEYVVTVNAIGVGVTKTKFEATPDVKSVDTEIILATSGTSGTPKLVKYSISKLTATCHKDIIRGAEFFWGLCYDLNRFAGIQVYFQAICSGSSIAVSEASQSMQEIISCFVINHVNALSATPSFWRKVLMLPGSRNLKVKRITLGGEISDQSIIDGLRNHFPESKIVHIYASTEAGVGFVVQDNKQGFPASYLNNPELSANLKVVNNILWIKSSNSLDKLLSGNIEIDTDGYINSGDIVDVHNDRVYFKGRDSGSLNVGGNKVMPEEVEQVLNHIDEVELSNVYGKKNAMLGTLVTADIVLSEHGKVLEKKVLKQIIVNFCKPRLAAYKIPVTFKIVENIAINENGKIVRY